MKNCVRASLLIFIGSVFSSCAVAPSPVGYSAKLRAAPTALSKSSDQEPAARTNMTLAKSQKMQNFLSPENRPGLATTQGKKIKSKISYTEFIRENKNKPRGTGLFYYNDQQGIDAMVQRRGRYQDSGLQSSAGGLIAWGVRTGFRYAKSYISSGTRYVVGRTGREYSLVIKNKAQSRLEILVSVDGYDVLSGRPGSYSHRGYIVAAGDTLVIKGFRTSESAVRAFKFSSVRDSFAHQVRDNAKNVGVIGVAVFTERDVNPWLYSPEMVEERLKAKPF